MTREIGKARVELVKEDITLMEVDAFVFYARPELKLGTGWGTAISVRGGPSVQQELDEARNKKGKVDVGQVVVTGAGKLPAKHIFHAVGPAFNEPDLEQKLERTVEAVFEKAAELGITSLAMPPMGSGFYGVPPATSARICIGVAKKHLGSNGGKLEKLYFCLQDPRDFAPFEQVLKSI
ncbi:MAG: O-acetyl-ADP-ribose deacetylase [Deltaproteobacteria bacterium]|nr:MAG: O-acetyl-ADP-ribose deacetylase [Deltaproteobacteria bacterium]